MRTTAIVPVKRFGGAKQRLAEALTSADRAGLAAAMLQDVLAAIGRSERVARMLVVSGEPQAERIARAAGAALLDDPADRGHSEAAAIGVAAELERGTDAVALLPGDCPLLDPAELDAALATLGPQTVAVIPDRHGTGTNGLLLRPPDAIAPAFGPGSCARHLRAAERAGHRAETAPLPSLGLDLDTGEDLAALRAAIDAAPADAPATARALARLTRPERGSAPQGAGR